MTLAVRLSSFLMIGEVRLVKVGAYWTRKAGLPVHRVSLVVTDRRLLLIQPVISYYYLIGLPFLLPFGLLLGGWITIAGVLAAVVLLMAFAPRKLVSAHALDEIVARRTNKPTGRLRLFQREIVDISFADGDRWRLSADGRNVRSAASIENALADFDRPAGRV